VRDKYIYASEIYLLVVFIMLKMWMNAQSNWHVSAQSATAKIPGGVMNADAIMVYSMCGKVTCVLVSVVFLAF